MPKGYPQSILILSDEHRGAGFSNFPAYQRTILEKMRHYDHVVDLGDNTELFFTDKHFAQQYAPYLDTVLGQGEKHWRRQFEKLESELSKKEKYVRRIHGVMSGEQTLIEGFLDNNPHVHFHTVLGNHDDVRRFRNMLDRIQATHLNYEWSPESIRIGDGLFTHGHLPLSGKTDEQYPCARLRDASSKSRWSEIIRAFYPENVAPTTSSGKLKAMINLALKHKTHHYYHDEASTRMMYQLMKWSGTDDFHYVHERSKPIPFSLDWVKNIFFGHTHVKFDNYELDGVNLNNTGGVVETCSREPDDLGILEAKLNADGTITDIQPVRLEKDPVQIAVPGLRR